MDFMGVCSPQTFKKYITAGMPARFEGNRWVAHADNINDWFKKYTAVSMRKVMDQIIDEKPCQEL